MTTGNTIDGQFPTVPDNPFPLPYEARSKVIPEGEIRGVIDPVDIIMRRSIAARAAVLTAFSLFDIDRSVSSSVLLEDDDRVVRLNLKTNNSPPLTAKQAELVRDGYFVPGIRDIEESTWVTVVYHDVARSSLQNIRANRSIKLGTRRYSDFDASRSKAENSLPIDHAYHTVNTVLRRHDPQAWYRLFLR